MAGRRVLPTLVVGEAGTQFRSNRMTGSGSYYYTNKGPSADVISIVRSGTSAGAAEKLIGLRPSWSPDGTQLAFLRNRPSAAGNNYDLLVYSLETGEETVYTHPGIEFAAPPEWFHDG